MSTQAWGWGGGGGGVQPGCSAGGGVATMQSPIDMLCPTRKHSTRSYKFVKGA